MSAGSFYQVKVFTSFRDQQCLNEYWYRQGAGSGGAPELAGAIEADLLTTIFNNQHELVKGVALKTYNWNNALDFDERSLTSWEGALTGDCLPSFVAVGFTCLRGRTDMKPGQKRFVGVPANVDDAGIITNAGYITGLLAQEVVLGQTLSHGGSGSDWSPVIVRRINFATPPAKDYRPPVTITASDYYFANVWNYRTELTSQNSRKIGRGS